MSPRLKKWGGDVPHVPHQIAPMHTAIKHGVVERSKSQRLATEEHWE